MKEFLASAVPTAGGRVYPGWVPQQGTYPAVTYLAFGDGAGLAHGGPEDLATRTYQIDLWALTYSEARAMAAALRAALHGFAGLLGSAGTRVQPARLVDARDTYENDPKLWRVSQDYAVTYKE